MNLKIVWIVFSSSFLIGCSSLSEPKEPWPMPKKPALLPVKISPVGSGYFMSQVSASNMTYNIEELRYYIKKLELLLEGIAKQHYIYLEEYIPSER